jgi:predicted transport protein
MATPDDAVATMMKNLEAKTGKSLAQWIEIARGCGKEKHGEIVNYLKSEHGIGHGYANAIVHGMKDHPSMAAATGKAPAARPATATGGGSAVDGLFAGKKADLRPIYDALMNAINKFGKDIELAPKQAYVSLRRSKQFACLHPSTATRFDVGIQLKGVEPVGRLESSGSWNAMVSHRVRVETVDEVNAELIGWLKQAYDKA